jgi:hypothetical protein
VCGSDGSVNFNLLLMCGNADLVARKEQQPLEQQQQ